MSNQQEDDYNNIINEVISKHPEIEDDDNLDTITSAIYNSSIIDNYDSEVISDTIEDEIKLSKKNQKNIQSIQGVQGSKSTLQQYFDDVGFVYEKNNNDCNIEYSQENREKLIEMNLKCVIRIAKSYRGMGLSLEELISAGNEGLCIAFDKYDPKRNKWREELLHRISEVESDEISIDWIEENIGVACQYGKLKKKYQKAFDGQSVVSRDFVERWVKKNITKATFNSVAMLWVNAAIHQELDNYSRLIRKPKKEIEKEKTGESKKEVYLDINAPINDDSNNTLADVLDVQDTIVSDMDIREAHESMHDLLKILFEGIKTRDKRILLQRFGVGYVRPMLPKEISERENISVARVSQIINITLEKMRENANRLNINPSNMFQMLEHTDKMF